MRSLLDSLFHLEARGTTVGRELRGAAATFLTMAYILVANPGILSAGGVPFDAAVAATAAAAAVCSILMGLVANVPIALAPGMGLNAVVAYQLASAAGSWQAAMGLVVVEGLLVLLLVALGLRGAVMAAIPEDLKRGIGAGIGLFIALIGCVNARLVVVPPGTIAVLAQDPAAVLPPVGPGGLGHAETALAFAGLLVIGALMLRRWPGALLAGLAIVTLAALALGVARLPAGGWLRAPSFATFFQADLSFALQASAVPLVLSLMMVDFFDTIGTASAVTEEAGLAGPGRPIPRLNRLLAVDAASASIGGLFGASSVTSYIESAAGVAEGARTGLHSVFVGLMFAAAIVTAPALAIVPAAATAPVLIAVGFLMAGAITRIDITRIETALPAFATIILIPFTYSIAHGIGYGFIGYVAMQLLGGRARQVHPLMYGVAAAFGLFFWME